MSETIELSPGQIAPSVALFQSGAKSISFEAKVFRAATQTWEDLGTVAYWHKNPIKRLWWSMKHRFKNPIV